MRSSSSNRCRVSLRIPDSVAGTAYPDARLNPEAVTVYKGDRKAIGGLRHPRKPEQPFHTIQVACRPGDKFFFFTDGLTRFRLTPSSPVFRYFLRLRNTLLKCWADAFVPPLRQLVAVA